MKINNCNWCNNEFSSKRVAKFCSSNCRSKFRYSIKKDEIAQYKRKYFQKYKNTDKYKNQLVGDNRKGHDKVCSLCGIDYVSTRVDSTCCSQKCSAAKWRSNNKNYIKQDQKYRYNNDISRRISTNIRSRLNKALKGAYKVDSTVASLECSPEELKKHLESQFQDDMSWDNYGVDGWHIDHIKPLASFDLTDKIQFRKACHYTNLQPLWAEENLSKGSKDAT